MTSFPLWLNRSTGQLWELSWIIAQAAGLCSNPKLDSFMCIARNGESNVQLE